MRQRPGDTAAADTVRRGAASSRGAHVTGVRYLLMRTGWRAISQRASERQAWSPATCLAEPAHSRRSAHPGRAGTPGGCGSVHTRASAQQFDRQGLGRAAGQPRQQPFVVAATNPRRLPITRPFLMRRWPLIVSTVHSGTGRSTLSPSVNGSRSCPQPCDRCCPTSDVRLSHLWGLGRGGTRRSP